MEIFLEHTCGAQDERDCSIMKHLILAEIRKSNAPAWVVEELEKKLNCRGCWIALARRPASVCLAAIVPDRLSASSGRYEPKSSGNDAIHVKA